MVVFPTPPFRLMIETHTGPLFPSLTVTLSVCTYRQSSRRGVLSSIDRADAAVVPATLQASRRPGAAGDPEIHNNCASAVIP